MLTGSTFKGIVLHTLLKPFQRIVGNISLSFGWIGNVIAEQAGLDHKQFSPTVPYSHTPPWLFVKPSVNFEIQQQSREWSKQVPVGRVAELYGTTLFRHTHSFQFHAVFIPHDKVHIKKKKTQTIYQCIQSRC